MWDVTPVSITLTEGIDKNGDKKVVGSFSGKCNLNESTKTMRMADGQLIQLTASIVIGGDIAPTLSTVQGTVTINGKTWNIFTADRPRNPDGTVHHTRLGLI